MAQGQEHAGSEVQSLLAEGMALHRAGKPAAAVPFYKRVLRRAPNHAEATGLLGLAALQAGDPETAVELIEKAAKLAPDNPRTHCNLGVALNAAGRQEEAVFSFARAIELQPDYAEAWTNRGMALKHVRRPEAAVENHRQAIALKPKEAGFHLNLANALVDVGDIHEAEAAYRRALELRPGYPNALSGLAVVLQEIGRGDEAVAAGEAAVAGKLDADHLRHLGNAYHRTGQLEKAASAYRRALELEPSDTQVWRALAGLEALPAPNAEYERLRRLWDDQSLAAEKRFHAGLALARWLDDLGVYDESYSCFVAANAIKAGQVNWSAERFQTDLDLILGLFNPPPELDPLPETRAPGPIFVVGLPRAGKTTLEGMLTRHPQVRPAGELRTMSVLGRELSLEHRLSVPGANLSSVPRERLVRFGERYVEYVRHLVPAPFISVDTMPPNFRHIGLIRATLPNARIINCVRDPLEHSVAIFRKFFARETYDYSYDLAEIATHYRTYANTMDDWRRLFPGFVLDVDIADLRRDPDAGMRRVLDFCGLDFDPACAAYHDSEPRRFADRLPPADPEARLAPYRKALDPLLSA